jgi:hypothetical protein
MFAKVCSLSNSFEDQVMKIGNISTTIGNNFQQRVAPHMMQVAGLDHVVPG